MRSMWRLALGWILLIGCVWAQTLTPNDVVPGEILLTMRPGTAIEKARALATQHQAPICAPFGVPDTYVLRLRDQQGATPAVLLERVQQASRAAQNRCRGALCPPSLRGRAWMRCPTILASASSGL
jgi:hypothetical protein